MALIAGVHGHAAALGSILEAPGGRLDWNMDLSSLKVLISLTYLTTSKVVHMQ